MKKNLKIRKAFLSDIPLLKHISVSSKRYWKYPDAWIEKWMDDLTLKENDLKIMTVKVAVLNEKLVGFGAIKENSKQYEIMHLWVLPEMIGENVGKELLQKLLATLITNKPVIVESDPNAVGFYQKFGFRKIKETPSYPEGRFLPVLMLDSPNSAAINQWSCHKR